MLGQMIQGFTRIEECHAGSAAEIRAHERGNLCRFTAHPNIVATIEIVRDARKS
jgi:aerobic-type carbon monoxide dehydrogenase small subunit (CoxS/CutS family)